MFLWITAFLGMTVRFRIYEQRDIEHYVLSGVLLVGGIGVFVYLMFKKPRYC